LKLHHRGTEGTEQSYCKTDNHEAHEGHEEEQGKNPLDGVGLAASTVTQFDIYVPFVIFVRFVVKSFSFFSVSSVSLW
jgi:hypothetical protein